LPPNSGSVGYDVHTHLVDQTCGKHLATGVASGDLDQAVTRKLPRLASPMPAGIARGADTAQKLRDIDYKISTLQNAEPWSVGAWVGSVTDRKPRATNCGLIGRWARLRGLQPTGIQRRRTGRG
jgi:hypothetical protein